MWHENFGLAFWHFFFQSGNSGGSSINNSNGLVDSDASLLYFEEFVYLPDIFQS